MREHLRHVPRLQPGAVDTAAEMVGKLMETTVCAVGELKEIGGTPLSWSARRLPIPWKKIPADRVAAARRAGGSRCRVPEDG